MAIGLVAAGAQAAQEPNEPSSNVVGPPVSAPEATSEPVAVAAPPPPAPPPSGSPNSPKLAPFGVRLAVEAGFIGVLSNVGQFGAGGARIDLRAAAGQDNLLPYTRWSAELDLGRRSTLVFLYQPFSSDGSRTPTSDERIEGVRFTAGTPLRTEFGFPYYRLSYLFDVTQSERGHLAFGVTGQLRNADYRYTSLDGTAFARSSSVGFVPALKARAELMLSPTTFVGFEADGIYAPISGINGSTNRTVGAILDASLRAGVRVRDSADVFVNVRYLGGGATNEDPANFAKNWLHTVFVGLGASLELTAPATVHRPRGGG